MLVKELRNAISKYTNEEKDNIIVELYKRIPKAKKEDYDIDNFILNIQNKEKNKTAKKQENLSIKDLKKQVDFFISCANQNLYVAPNRVIPKSERSKWRFKVKDFYKKLSSIKADTPDGIIATDLLKDLYRLLSYSSCYLTFTTWETFRAIGVSQSDFLLNIVKRKLINGINKENIEYCIDLLNMEYSPYEYHSNILVSFKSCLNTPDAKYLAIECLKEHVTKKLNKLKELKKAKKETFDCEESISYFVETIFYIYFDLCEYDNGIKYFHKNYVEERDDEIKEYVLLELIEFYDLPDVWIKEYESHPNIKYRDTLKEKYKKVKKNKKFD